MEWDAESGGLRCRSCGAKVSVQKAAPEGFHDYESLPSFPAIQDDKEKSVRCPACGAEIKTGSRTVSETCPSCGAGFVSADKLLSFARPDGLAPFMIPPDRVDGLLRKECSRRLLAPGFSSGRIRGRFISRQYITLWVFSAGISTEYAGYGSRLRQPHRLESDEKEGSRLLSDWEPFKGRRSDLMENVCVPADPETDDACYRRILFSSTPQDALCAWQPEYLLGSWSFLPAVSASNAEAKAREEMKAEIRKRIEKEQYEASEFKNLSYRTFDLKYNNKAWRLVQIPAYFVISSYRGGFYFEAVNGATGEVFGDFPVSSIRLAVLALLVAAGTALLCVAIDWDDVIINTDGGYGIDHDRALVWFVFFCAVSAVCLVAAFLGLTPPIYRKDDLKNKKWLREITERAYWITRAADASQSSK